MCQINLFQLKCMYFIKSRRHPCRSRLFPLSDALSEQWNWTIPTSNCGLSTVHVLINCTRMRLDFLSR